jgi:hypothetical protein
MSLTLCAYSMYKLCRELAEFIHYEIYEIVYCLYMAGSPQISIASSADLQDICYTARITH